MSGTAVYWSSYGYDKTGNRLIARTPTESALYLSSTEITVANGTTTPKGTRYADLGGGTIAKPTGLA